MPKIVIKELGPLDGEYVLDLQFTHRDLRTIKQMAGVRAAEVEGALEAGDTDVYVALASIALRRAGVSHNPELLWDAQIGGITLDFLEGEQEEVEEDSPQPSADEAKSGGSIEDSGTSTNGAMDSSQEIETPLSSGTPQQDSTSVPAT